MFSAMLTDAFRDQTQAKASGTVLTRANPSPDHVKSSEVFPEEYNVFRKDRNCLGGGIFILIHKSLTAVEQPELSTDCEILWAKLKLQN
ncbi:hypothetical protein ACOMHN_018046 [Nucella lapillus]